MFVRGDVYYADLGVPRGTEQAGRRPVLILQDETIYPNPRTAVVIPFTTTGARAQLPTCVLVQAGIGGLTADSVALCHEVRALDTSRIGRRLGTLPPDVIEQIENTLIRTLRL